MTTTAHTTPDTAPLLESFPITPIDRVLVVIPTYCEAANITTVVTKVRDTVPTAHILIVDDNSPDGTAAIGRELTRRVGRMEVLVRSNRDGLGAAYRTGFAWGLERGFDVLVEMDADLSHDPAAVPLLLAEISRGADLAIGSRYVPGGAVPGWTTGRRALSRYGNWYAGFMLGLDTADLTSGYRAFTADALRIADYASTRASGYAFQIELAHRVGRARRLIREVPITFNDRRLGKSKMTTRITVEALALVTWWGVRDRARRWIVRPR
jgi:dolichol-phosphate mannosyltransferase